MYDNHYKPVLCDFSASICIYNHVGSSSTKFTALNRQVYTKMLRSDILRPNNVMISVQIKVPHFFPTEKHW